MAPRNFTNKEHIKWRMLVLERDENQCVVCGNGPKFLNAHHLVPSEYSEFKFSKDNGITLCPKHHTLGKESAHKNPIWFVEWMKENRPKALERSINRMNYKIFKK